MSRHAESSLQSVARRLRFLRGADTQEAFSKRIGVSRSALANYETGRSRPDDFILAKISANAGVPIDYFTSHHDPAVDSSVAASLGASIEGVPDWSEDEATVIRILRLCDPATVQDVLQLLTARTARQDFVVNMSTIFTVRDDLQRLLDIAAGKRPFEKGPLTTYPEDSPLHAIGFKNNPDQGPR